MNDNEIAEVERVEDILIFRYKLDLPVNLEMARTFARIKNEHTKGVPHKCVFVFPKLLNMEKAGRDYLASDEAQDDVLIACLVAQSALGRAILNFFVRLNGSKSSNKIKRVFKSEEAAIEWLKEFDVKA